MKHLGYLEKDGWTIRVSSGDLGEYKLEYSNDGFMSKKVKSYKDKEELLGVLNSRFDESQLDFL